MKYFSKGILFALLATIFTVCSIFYIRTKTSVDGSLFLEKRARLAFMEAIALAALVVAAASYATPYWVVAACGYTQGLCARIAGGVIATISTTIAAIIVGQGVGSDSGSGQAKRSVELVTSFLAALSIYDLKSFHIASLSPGQSSLQRMELRSTESMIRC